jgi:hypothetical protein
MATQRSAIIYAPRQLIKLVRGLQSDSDSGFTLVDYGPYGLMDMDAPESLPAGSVVRMWSHPDGVAESIIHRAR